MEIITKQESGLPRCVLCNTVENVQPFRYTPEAAELFKATFTVTPDDAFKGGICARCTALPQDERRALVELGLQSALVEIMQLAGLPLERARREAANLDISRFLPQRTK